MTAARYYVRRSRDGRVGWVGPIAGERQSAREVDAWRDCGWNADAYPESPELRHHVNQWQNQANKDHGR